MPGTRESAMNEAAQGPVLKELRVQGREEGCEQEGTPPTLQHKSYRIDKCMCDTHMRMCVCTHAYTVYRCIFKCVLFQVVIDAIKSGKVWG